MCSSCCISLIQLAYRFYGLLFEIIYIYIYMLCSREKCIIIIVTFKEMKESIQLSIVFWSMHIHARTNENPILCPSSAATDFILFVFAFCCIHCMIQIETKDAKRLLIAHKMCAYDLFDSVKVHSLLVLLPPWFELRQFGMMFAHVHT